MNWAMIMCLKLVALHLGANCGPNEDGVMMFSAMSVEPDSAIGPCKATACPKEMQGFIVVPLPRHHAIIAVTDSIDERTLARIVLLAPMLDR